MAVKKIYTIVLKFHTDASKTPNTPNTLYTPNTCSRLVFENSAFR